MDVAVALEMVLLLLLVILGIGMELIATVLCRCVTAVVVFTLLLRVGVTHVLTVLVIRQVVGLLLLVVVVILMVLVVVVVLGIVLGIHSTIIITCLLLHNRCRGTGTALLLQRTA